MKKLVAAAVAGAVLAVAATSSAGTTRTAAPSRVVDAAPISYGVADDVGKYADDGGAWFNGQLAGAQLTEERWSLLWDPNAPTTIEELPFLERAAPVAQSAGVHVVLALYSAKASAHDPNQFCAWAGQVASTVKGWGITDFIVGNEPNIRTFWVPQKDSAGNDVAAPAYEQLLAACYDSIKAADSDARVIGMGLSPHATSSDSNHPLVFLRDVGAAYRASGRTTPIMDQLAIHPYPNPASPADPPAVGYRNADDFGIPNLDRVKQAVYDAFNGTGQPTTVSTGARRASSAGRSTLSGGPLTFRIDEVGWQVDTSALPQYVGTETVKTVTPDQQAAYLQQMIQHFFACDPTVTDVLLFHLEDEKYRGSKDENGNYVGGGWQSGLITYGGPGVSEQRPAYATVAQLAAQGRSACASGRFVAWKPGSSAASSSRSEAATPKAKRKRHTGHRTPKPKPKPHRHHP